MTVEHLDENRARPYSRVHDQRRDHVNRSPPPHLSGMGGRLRLDCPLCRRIRSAAFSFSSSAI
jgi:hypothetical protein